MSRFNGNRQIEELLSQGLGVAEVAEALEVDEILVKMVAQQIAGLKKDRGEELFTDEECKEAAVAIGSLVYSENEFVKLQASKFVINEKKGRNDVKDIGSMGDININLINVQMKRAREAIQKAEALIEV